MIDFTPQSRFPEFHGQWKQHSFSDFTRINQGLQIPISERLLTKDGNSYFYITNEFLRPQSSKKYFVKNPSLSVVCSSDDILMTRTGNTGQVVTGVSGVFHNNFFKIKFDGKVAIKEFLVQLLRHHHTQHTILKLAGTSTIPDLNHSDFYRIKVYIPSVKEQQKIADFLSAVDKKIRLLKEKHTLLQQYKKGVMQKLFSQEIRFEDDNGQAFPDWSDTPVGEFMTESKVLGSKGDQAKKLTVKLWGKGVFSKDESQKGSENTQYYTRSSGQFIYSKLDFLNCAFGIVPEELDGYESTVDLPCFDVAPSINKYFILEYIKQKRFYKKFGDMADGSRKAKRIHAKDFLSFIVELPSESEQQKIAEFLQALDTKLDAVQQQIELTQTFKKGLLQQMFV